MPSRLMGAASIVGGDEEVMGLASHSSPGVPAVM